MSDWTSIFFETLDEHVQPYIEAYGDLRARAKILKDCTEDITKSPLYDEHIELPQPLCWVSILFTKVPYAFSYY